MDMANFMPNIFTGNKVTAPFKLAMDAPVLCNNALADPKTQNLLKEEFDLVMLSMFFADCFLSVVYQLKASCLK